MINENTIEKDKYITDDKVDLLLMIDDQDKYIMFDYHSF